MTDDEFDDEFGACDPNELEPVLQRLSDAFDHDLEPVPSRLTDAARAAFGWRVVDDRLAELLESPDGELIGVRGAATDRRSFRYAAGEFVIRVHLTPRTLVLMIEPPLSVVCRIVTSEGVEECRTDDLGEYAGDAPDLPVRVEADLPSGTTVTPWITG